MPSAVRSSYVTSLMPLHPDALKVARMKMTRHVYDSHRLQAREVCLLYPGIITAPVRDTDPDVEYNFLGIWIIMPNNYDLATSTCPDVSLEPLPAGIKPLGERLEELHLSLTTESSNPPLDIFKSCIRFTVEARIAPLWNRIADGFFEGRDFLTKTVLNAVTCTLQIRHDNKLRLTMRGGSFRLPLFQLEEYGISPRVLGEFSQGKTDVIPAKYIGQKEVVILPNLTKGRVQSVTRNLLKPEESNASEQPLESWKDVRRYWKNTYGYRLPEDPPPYFVNVSFGKRANAPVLSYPMWCVRQFEPTPIPRANAKDVSNRFVIDLTGKITHICGQKLSFRTKKDIADSPEMVSAAGDALPPKLQLPKDKAPVEVDPSVLTASVKNIDGAIVAKDVATRSPTL